MPIHLIFDLLAAALSFAATAAAYQWRVKDSAAFGHIDAGYAAVLLAGAVIGGFGLGTLNLWLTGLPGIGRSILGALAGAIVAIEIYKRCKGIAGSTGLIFVASFPVSVMIGRIGCFLSGITDHTYGTATTLPWGHDFGDGTLRHPVQLYESAAMAMFLIYAAFVAHKRQPVFMQNGFYLMVAAYAGQRFGLEFLKPYAQVVGPLNLFQLVCAALVAYAAWMIMRGHNARYPALRP